VKLAPTTSRGTDLYILRKDDVYILEKDDAQEVAVGRILGHEGIGVVTEYACPGRRPTSG